MTSYYRPFSSLPSEGFLSTHTLEATIFVTNRSKAKRIKLKVYNATKSTCVKKCIASTSFKLKVYNVTVLAGYLTGDQP